MVWSEDDMRGNCKLKFIHQKFIVINLFTSCGQQICDHVIIVSQLPVSKVCEAAPKSLFWTPNELNKHQKCLYQSRILSNYQRLHCIPYQKTRFSPLRVIWSLACVFLEGVLLFWSVSFDCFESWIQSFPLPLSLKCLLFARFWLKLTGILEQSLFWKGQSRCVLRS